MKSIQAEAKQADLIARKQWSDQIALAAKISKPPF